MSDLDILAQLDRAHRMSCSDPSDPTRETLYGEAAKAIRAARAQALEDLIAQTESRGRSDIENGQYITAQRRRSGLWLLREELARIKAAITPGTN